MTTEKSVNPVTLSMANWLLKTACNELVIRAVTEPGGGKRHTDILLFCTDNMETLHRIRYFAEEPWAEFESRPLEHKQFDWTDTSPQPSIYAVADSLLYADKFWSQQKTVVAVAHNARGYQDIGLSNYLFRSHISRLHGKLEERWTSKETDHIRRAFYSRLSAVLKNLDLEWEAMFSRIGGHI